jgi:acid stress-induced BolA-like protein IbaG/YrbA
MTPEELQTVLQALPFETEIAVHAEGRRLVGVVVARIFEGMNEAERQRRVWHHLHERLDDRQLVRVEFVFTNSPAEDAALGAG